MGKFITGISYVAMAVCFVMVFVVAVDVILRKVSGQSITIKGSNEFSSYFLIFVTVLGIPVLQVKRGHVWVNMFVDMTPTRVRNFWLFVVTLVEAIVIAMLVVGTMQTASIYGTTAVTDILNMPKRYFAWVIAFGFTELFVVLMIDAIQFLINAIKGVNDDGAAEQVFAD